MTIFALAVGLLSVAAVRTFREPSDKTRDVKQAEPAELPNEQ